MANTATDFLDTLEKRMPFPVKAIQVDGGAEFETIFEEVIDITKLYALCFTLKGVKPVEPG